MIIGMFMQIFVNKVVRFLLVLIILVSFVLFFIFSLFVQNLAVEKKKKYKNKVLIYENHINNSKTYKAKANIL
jgi:hypothetical protein